MPQTFGEGVEVLEKRIVLRMKKAEDGGSEGYVYDVVLVELHSTISNSLK